MNIRNHILVLIMLFLYWCSPHGIRAEEGQFRVGDSKNSVISSLGQPEKETKNGEYVVLWYDSIAPSFATLYYFKEEIVEMISAFIDDKSKTLKTYIDQYGDPEQSLFVFKDPAEDSLRQRIHIWPKQGKAVITSGDDDGSIVIRQMSFASMTLDEYMNSWGAMYKDHMQATISSSLAPSVSPVPQQISGISIPPWVFIIAGLFVCGGILLIRSKFKAKL